MEEPIGNDRQDEVSDMLFNMGMALMDEGDDDADYIIEQTGKFLILVSGVMTNEYELDKLTDLCSMYSAKKILDSHLNESGVSLDEQVKKLINNLKNGFDNPLNEDEQ